MLGYKLSQLTACTYGCSKCANFTDVQMYTDIHVHASLSVWSPRISVICSIRITFALSAINVYYILINSNELQGDFAGSHNALSGPV